MSSVFKSETMIASEVKMNEAVEGRPSVGLPISVKDSRVVMLPFAVEHQKHWLEKDKYLHQRDFYHVASASYSAREPNLGSLGGSGLRWHNVIFKDLDSGKEWLLLDKRGVITEYGVLGPVEKEGAEWTFTPVERLFKVTTRDTDGDGVLTVNDLTEVVAAGLSGENIRTITPAGVDCVSFRWDSEVDELFLRCRADTNQDSRFDGLDESEPYVLKPGAPQAVRLVGGAVKRKADGLLR